MIINNWRNGFGNDKHTNILIRTDNTLDSGNTMTDISWQNNTVTNNDSTGSYPVVHSTVQSKFEGDSLLFSGNTYAQTYKYVSTPISGTVPGRDDLCVDFWVYIDGVKDIEYNDSLYVGFFGLTKSKPFDPDISNFCGIHIANQFDEVYFKYLSGNTTQWSIGGDELGLNENEWHHLAGVRYTISNTYYRLYLDGILIDRQDELITSRLVDVVEINSAELKRGGDNNHRKFYVDEWRNNVGNYRWISEFYTPNREF